MINSADGSQNSQDKSPENLQPTRRDFLRAGVALGLKVVLGDVSQAQEEKKEIPEDIRAVLDKAVADALAYVGTGAGNPGEIVARIRGTILLKKIDQKQYEESTYPQKLLDLIDEFAGKENFLETQARAAEIFGSLGEDLGKIGMQRLASLSAIKRGNPKAIAAADAAGKALDRLGLPREAEVPKLMNILSNINNTFENQFAVRRLLMKGLAVPNVPEAFKKEFAKLDNGAKERVRTHVEDASRVREFIADRERIEKLLMDIKR